MEMGPTQIQQNENQIPTPNSPKPKELNPIIHSRKSYSEWDTDFSIGIFTGVRVLAPIVWSLSIAYASYQLYLATDDFIPFQKDDLMNPGPFSSILRRGRDGTDRDWGMYTEFLFTKFIWYILGYIVINCMIGNLSPKIKLYTSTTFSFLLCLQLIGIRGLGFLVSLPITYSILKILSQRKAVIWGFTLVGLVLLNLRSVTSFIVTPGLEEFDFQIIAAWTYARCISITFDTWNSSKCKTFGIFWNNNNTNSEAFEIWKKSIGSGIAYVFYFPILTHGPFIHYSDFERDLILAKGASASKISGEVFIKKLSKIIGIFILNELILSYLYFGSFSLTTPALRKMNLWALGGVVYWLGQFFMLKYLVFYGLSSCIAEFDGVKVPALPKCPAHIHRYSVLWKDFDPGLYGFIVRYVYVPSIEEIQSHWSHRISSPALQKWLASLISFAYIYVWHSTVFEIFVWSSINFIGISVEKVGIWLSQKIDQENQSATGQVLHPKVWTFLIEPLVTVPLAGMSILNSTIFCGDLDAAIVFSRRLVFQNPHLLYLFGILYALTHTSIGIRSLEQKQKSKSVQEQQ